MFRKTLGVLKRMGTWPPGARQPCVSRDFGCDAAVLAMPPATPGFRTPGPATSRGEPDDDKPSGKGAAVTVAVRLKPSCGADAVTSRKGQQVFLRNPRTNEKKQFAFDHVFDNEGHAVRCAAGRVARAARASS